MKKLAQPAIYPYLPMHKHYGFAVFKFNEISHYLKKAQDLKNSEPNCIITWFVASEIESTVQNNPDIDQFVILDGSAESLENEIPRLQSERSWSGFFASEKSSGKRILLGQLASNGDCLYATTLARQIKHDYPNCHLTWAVSSLCRGMVEGNPFVDEIWEIPVTTLDHIQMAADWYKFEQEVQNRAKKGEFDEIFLTQIYPNNYQNYDGTIRSSIFRAYPNPITVPVQNILRLRDEEVKKVRNFAEQHNLQQRRYVILFECTSRSRQSFVTPDYALWFAQGLLSRLPDCSIILSSNVKISSVDERIIDGSMLSLRENAELTKYCTILIGCSSGITQTALTDWAKPLPMIQLLLASQSVFASIVHDLEYWGYSSEQVLEMTDLQANQLIECVYTALTQNFAEARRQFHQQITLNFDSYLNHIRSYFLQKGEYLKTAWTLLNTVERYGWHPQLQSFTKMELMPKINVHKTNLLTDEDCTKFLTALISPQVAKSPKLAEKLTISGQEITSKYQVNQPKIKVLYDISILGQSHYDPRSRTGVFRVVERVANGLLASPEVDLHFSAIASPQIFQATQNYLQANPNFQDVPLHQSTELTEVDIFHSPYYGIPTQVINGQKFLTIYDLIPIKYPEFFMQGAAELLKQSLANLKPDDWVICISNSTKNDLCSYTGINPNRVFVTHLAASPEIFYPCLDSVKIALIRSKYQIPESPYILSLSTLEPRKNIDQVIRCFVKLVREQNIKDLNLVLVGTKGWNYDRIFAEIDSNPELKNRIILTGYVADEDLAALYSSALVFVYPSLYEGFGLPPLEAMQCGIPVITSNTSSLPEVVGEAGIMLDPHDTDGICRSILQIYTNPSLRAAMSRKSLEQAKKFSWEKCIQQTIKAYKMALNNNNLSQPDKSNSSISLTTKTSKILVDAVMFQIHHSGITRVWKSLFEEWATQDFAQQILVLDRNGTFPKIPGIKYRQIPAYDYSKTDADREMLQKICDEEQADIFISTYYTTPRSTPSVFMAHDMIPEVTGADLGNPMWREKHYGIAHACAYISVSENTARDLVKYFPHISPESITVAHCGIDRTFSPSTLVAINQFKLKYGILKPYFLWVGDRVGFNGYKNAIVFFQAFSKLENKHEFEIVCVGGNSALENELKTYTSDIKVNLLRLTDDELCRAYSGALALVQTSKYEGFGLPLLEAIACGCPVIAAQNSSIPEVVGQAALYVNSDDVEELKKALIEVQNFHSRQGLISAGLAQAKKFSWSEMAQKVSEALIAATQIYAQKSVAPPPSINSITSIIQQYQSNQSDLSTLANIRQARKQIAEIWLNLPSLDQLATAYAGDVGKAHQSLLNCGLKDESVTDTEQTFVNQLAAQISQGFDHPQTINYLLAAMLYRRADQLPIKYESAAIPNFFINDYLKFMFACPNLFQEIGEADNYYRYFQGWLSYIHTNIFNNPDVQIWQNIASFFTQTVNFIPLYFTTANLRDVYTKRAEIMELVLKKSGFQLDYVFPLRLTTRSKIRLGVLNDHFSPQTETFATLPVFEHLDRSKFEIFLYALNVSGHQLEQYCQSRVDKLVPLPKDFALQVQTIRDDDLDILFIGTNLTAINKPTTSLALHRLARVQTTSFCSPTTTGMRHIDYYIAGKWTIPDSSYQEQYQEKLAILNGSGFCFNYATQSEVPTLQPTRNSIGIAEEVTVFISGANFYKILPELRETWAKILAEVPNSILILYPFGPAWTRTYPTTPFVNNLYAVLAKYGVDSKRLLIVKQLPNRGDVKEFLGLADVYLDSYPYAGATSLIDPLQVSLPTVVMEGNALRFRQGAAMLREIEMSELIANSEASYIQLAVYLASNPQMRKIYRQKIQQKMQGNPGFLDSRAYAVSLGNLFQELFQKWQNSQLPLGSSMLNPGQQFLNQLVDSVNLYRRNSSSASGIASLRLMRKQFADFWLSVPAEQLNNIYESEVGKAYYTLLSCGFQNQPLTEEEQTFLQQLTQISKGLVHPKAINSLLSAMLYFTPGTMRIPDAKNRLPNWLINDYEQIFESEIAFNSDSGSQSTSSQLLAEYISSPKFLNQLLGCVNLYCIDPTDESVILELRQLRKQLADFWLNVPSEQLETIYNGEVKKGYQAILSSGFQKEPLLETEQTFLQELIEIGKGLMYPKAINSILGAMLYLPPGKMRVPDAQTRLPKWLIPDYDQVFESVFVVAETGDTLAEPIKQPQNFLPHFLTQLSTCVALYKKDSTAKSVVADLRKIRQQLADLLLKVPENQLENSYQTDLGKGYKSLLGSGIFNEPLIESERDFLTSLVTELSKGMTEPKAINHLLAAMLYSRPGQLQVQDANRCLPWWLLEDYHKFSKDAMRSNLVS
jgi:predicted O-linked N-acetylglucosamine transferase (SPINDLY family)/glycosyltransferase involved in cell wall biosynthesis